MSKLIRNKDENKKQPDSAQLLLPLSNSAVVSHLKACQGLAANHAKDAFNRYLHVLDDALSVEIEKAKSDKESSELIESQRMIRQSSSELERYFCGYLSEGFVKFKKRELKTNVAHNGEGGELSLVGNDELEETISISSITQRADSYYAEPLWALNQRLAVLNGGEHVTEASNPASPIQFCDSLRKALKLLPVKPNIKSLAYKVYDDQLLGLLKNVIEEINLYLKKQGVLPNLKYSLPTHEAPKSALAGDDKEAPAPESESSQEDIQGLPDPNLPPEEYQHSLLQAIRGLQSQLHASSKSSDLPPGGVVVSPDELLAALSSLQGEPVELPSLASSGDTIVPIDISELFKGLKDKISEENKDGVIDQTNMHTIDLVGLLFEYMLNDENLPDCVKALLSYLHTPFLKIAFADPGFFEQAEHPARLLLNSLAEAGSRWVGNDGSTQYEIYGKIKEVVDRVLKEFDNDVKIFTELLLEFNSYTKNIHRRQELMEKRATEKAQGEEKLREVKLKVNEEIRKRTEKKELPSAVLLFLLQPWSDFLSFALLRYGEKSEKWVKALGVVDDVLWGIEPKDNIADKNRQLEIHEDLLSVIYSGFETIGYDQAKGSKLIEALDSLLKLALQSKKAEPAPAPMRDKLERIAAEKAGAAEIHEEECSPEEQQMVESLKMIEFGTWFEFEGGKRLKVAWYNSRTSHYMLVDQMGKRVDMMSGLKMARAMIAGDAKIISGSSKPFFERALENIFLKLNQKAEAINPEGESHVNSEQSPPP